MTEPDSLKVRYIGPIDVVVVEGIAESIEQDDDVIVPIDLGRSLLQQRENFEPRDDAGREYVADLDRIDEVALQDGPDMDLGRLTKRQLRAYADGHDVDLDGVPDVKPDLIRAIFEALWPQPKEGA